MKLNYNKPKNQLIRNQNFEMSVKGMWYQYSTGTWLERSDPNWDVKSHHSTHFDSLGDFYFKQYPSNTERFPKSEKALVKYLKRHTELDGKQIRVSTKWVGHFLEVQM